MRNLLFLALIISLFSCRSLAPNRMFQTPDDYSFAVDTNRTVVQSYVIGPNDRLEMHIFSNDGFRLVDITNVNSGNNNNLIPFVSYVVELDSMVRLPIIGKVKIGGLTIREAEVELQTLYKKYYNDPFVLIKVTNRHVIVFNGDGGKGTVVTLQNDNTTLLEAIAQSGGISENGRAYRIKIIRGDMRNPEIHLVDISSIEGLRNSNLRILSNDVIYVEAAANYKQRIFQQLTPIVGIITAALLVVNIIQK